MENFPKSPIYFIQKKYLSTLSRCFFENSWSFLDFITKFFDKKFAFSIIFYTIRVLSSFGV
ncbi:hypothetical protein BLM37_04745 [Candidatus Gracilibacteria bacterium GN02-873]|nr:hypothetical protein BLM37_04745 [Candidatus Gracilibacteria bacterium GN02-873]